MFLSPVLLKVVRKKTDIAGYDIETYWTVVYTLPAVGLQAVTNWLADWVLVLPCKMTTTTHSNPGLLQQMFLCNLQSVPQKHLTLTVPPWSSKGGV